MAELGHSWRFEAQDYQWAIGQALLRRARLQEEGHASAISTARDPLSGRDVVVIIVTAGRPEGWSDVFGDDDAELSLDERAHFGLDARP